jgi:hypothetical protein
MKPDSRNAQHDIATAGASENMPSLQARLADHPILQRALRRVKESQEQDTHMAHHTKHTSHSTHSKGVW